MANFEAFHWLISSSINLLFLKSDQLVWGIQQNEFFKLQFQIPKSSYNLELSLVRAKSCTSKKNKLGHPKIFLTIHFQFLGPETMVMAKSSPKFLQFTFSHNWLEHDLAIISTFSQNKNWHMFNNIAQTMYIKMSKQKKK